MMKKIYSLTLTGLMFAGLSAQSLQKSEVTASDLPQVANTQFEMGVGAEERAAVGDTLMYVPLAEIFVTDPGDATAYSLQTFDQDGAAAAAALAGTWTSGTDFLLFYDPTPGGPSLVPIDAMLHPDTAYYFGGTSWHNPVGQADNWITMGPITIPATGGTFGWRVRTPDQAYRDGYKVLIGNVGFNPTDFSPSDEVFNKNDNTGVIGEDTVWTYRSVNVPAAFAGQQVYFAIQHEANDMFIIYFDEFLALEANNLGTDINQFDGFAFNQVMPNPATDVAYINYSIGNASEVSFIVTDINGRVVANINQGTKESGIYNYGLSVTEFASGIYQVTLKAGQFSSTKKLVIAK